MIEIQVHIGDGPRYRLVLNGTVVVNALITRQGGKKRKGFIIKTKEDDITRKVAAHRFSQIPDEVTALRLRFDLDLDMIGKFVGVFRQSKEHFEIEFNFLQRNDWKRPYSFKEYHTEYRRNVRARNIKGLTIGESILAGGGFFVLCKSTSIETAIAEEVRRYHDLLQEINNEVEGSLSVQTRSDSVMMNFDFPEEVRVPCEQYLLYFVQFLRDLGVEATSDLRHQVGQVLFTVKPTDPRTALDKIHAALQVYLRLPSSPVSDSTHDEIAIQRLEANVLRVKSDLRLASAELQAKNATIEAQQIIINTQKGLLSGEIVFNSMKDVTPKPQDKEELIKDTLSIIPYQGKGFEVNLPEIFRRLKRLLRDE